MDVGHERGRTQRALADRARRRALFRQLRSGGAGARRTHRRPDLGARGERRGGPARQLEPQSRHLPGQALPGHGRRAADCARRAQRRGGLDHPHRRRRPGLPQHQRAGHRRRQGGAGARRLRPVHPRGLLHQRLRRRERRAALAIQHGGPVRRARRQHLGQPAGLPAAAAARPGSPAATIPRSTWSTSAWRRQSRGWRSAGA